MRFDHLALACMLLGACGDSAGAVDAAAGDDAIESGDAGIDAAACLDSETRPCGTDVGACSTGTETCAAGVWGSCVGGVIAATEICDGVLDENCDGVVDEGCTTDPFAPESCGGPPWTETEATTALDGLSRSVLASATMQVRSRVCPGGVCDLWQAPMAYVINYLTYSGGVTTRYMPLQMDMRLVLFSEQGTPKLSMQHVTFTAGNYPDTDGAVYGFPPVMIMYPHMRAFNVSPQFPSDYTDLDYQLKNGVLALGTHCARFTANLFGAAEPYTTEIAALFRW